MSSPFRTTRYPSHSQPSTVPPQTRRFSSASGSHSAMYQHQTFRGNKVTDLPTAPSNPSLFMLRNFPPTGTATRHVAHESAGTPVRAAGVAKTPDSSVSVSFAGAGPNDGGMTGDRRSMASRAGEGYSPAPSYRPGYRWNYPATGVDVGSGAGFRNRPTGVFSNIDVNVPIYQNLGPSTKPGAFAPSANTSATTSDSNLRFNKNTQQAAKKQPIFANDNLTLLDVADSAVLLALPSPDRFPEDATTETKRRLVFEEFDLFGRNQIDPESFHKIFLLLSFNFSYQTIDSTFKAADVSRNGSITYTDFMNWAESYPTLINALYFRFRNILERKRRFRELKACELENEKYQQAERHAMQMVECAERDVQQHEKSVSSQREKIHVLERHLNAVESEVHDADRRVREVEGSQSLQEHEQTLLLGQERQRRRAVDAVQRETHYAEGQVDVIGAQLEKAKMKEKEMEKLYLLAKEETNRIEASLQEHINIVQELVEKVNVQREEHHQIRNELQECQKVVADLDVQRSAAIANRVDRLAARTDAKSVLTAAVLHLKEELHTGGKELIFRAKDAKQKHTAATRELEDHCAQLNMLQNHWHEYLKEREAFETEELAHVLEEIGLRDEHLHLAAREERQASALSDFNARVGRADVVGPSASQSSARVEAWLERGRQGVASRRNVPLSSFIQFANDNYRDSAVQTSRRTTVSSSPSTRYRRYHPMPTRRAQSAR